MKRDAGEAKAVLMGLRELPPNVFWPKLIPLLKNTLIIYNKIFNYFSGAIVIEDLLVELRSFKKCRRNPGI